MHTVRNRYLSLTFDWNFWYTFKCSMLKTQICLVSLKNINHQLPIMQNWLPNSDPKKIECSLQTFATQANISNILYNICINNTFICAEDYYEIDYMHIHFLLLVILVTSYFNHTKKQCSGRSNGGLWHRLLEVARNNCYQCGVVAPLIFIYKNAT